MRLLRRLFRDARALAALALLTTLVVGGLADARHHLSARGCAGDAAGREDHCICASLHAAPLGSEPMAQPAPSEREFPVAVAAVASRPIARAACAASPRAPPRG